MAPVVTADFRSDSEPSQPRTYRTKHGTVSTMRTAGIGKPADQPAPAELPLSVAVPVNQMQRDLNSLKNLTV